MVCMFVSVFSILYLLYIITNNTYDASHITYKFYFYNFGKLLKVISKNGIIV